MFSSTELFRAAKLGDIEFLMIAFENATQWNVQTQQKDSVKTMSRIPTQTNFHMMFGNF